MSITDFIDAVVILVRDNAQWASVIVFLVAFGESSALLSILVPGWAILIGVGALIGSGSLDFWPMWASAAVGAAIGDWVSYWFGYYFKDRALQFWPLSRYPRMVIRGRDFFQRYGVWSIFIGRFFGPLRAVVPLIAGIMEMRRLPFQVANITSALLWAFILLAPTAAVVRQFL